MGHNAQVPDTLGRRLDWQARSACRADPDLFFDKDRQHEARRVCVANCPVRVACLAQVKEAEQGKARAYRSGVAAGLTSSERWRLDATAPGHADTPAIPPEGPEKCGSYVALLRHLWRGEDVDTNCWSAELARGRLHEADRSARQPRPALVEEPDAVAEPEPVAQPMEKPKPPNPGRTAKERHVYRLWTQGLPDLDIARRADLGVPAVRRIRGALGLLANLHVRKAS